VGKKKLQFRGSFQNPYPRDMNSDEGAETSALCLGGNRLLRNSVGSGKIKE
jgi:hypothetical protein